MPINKATSDALARPVAQSGKMMQRMKAQGKKLENPMDLGPQPSWRVKTQIKKKDERPMWEDDGEPRHARRRSSREKSHRESTREKKSRRDSAKPEPHSVSEATSAAAGDRQNSASSRPSKQAQPSEAAKSTKIPDVSESAAKRAAPAVSAAPAKKADPKDVASPKRFVSALGSSFESNLFRGSMNRGPRPAQVEAPIEEPPEETRSPKPTKEVTVQYRSVEERIAKCPPRELAQIMEAARRIQRFYLRKSTRQRARRIILKGSVFTRCTAAPLGCVVYVCV